MITRLVDGQYSELKIDHFEKVTILPTEESPKYVKCKSWLSGAFHHDGRFAVEIYPFYEFFPVNRNASLCKDITIEHLPIEAIYGGVIVNHYGHFITDTLSRFWYINTLKSNAPIILNIFNFTNLDYSDFKLSSFQKQYFDIVGVDTSRFIFVKNPICVESLIVPTKGFIGERYSNPEHFDSISCKSEIKKKYKKVWLSRSNYTSCEVEHVNILEVEDILRKAGWLIVYPEELNLAEQLDLFREARIVSGLEGSAFHTLAIIDQLPNLVVIFPRANKRLCEYDYTIAKVRKINQHVVELKYEKLNPSGSVLKIVDPYEPLNVLNNLESTL